MSSVRCATLVGATSTTGKLTTHSANYQMIKNVAEGIIDSNATHRGTKAFVNLCRFVEVVPFSTRYGVSLERKFKLFDAW